MCFQVYCFKPRAESNNIDLCISVISETTGIEDGNNYAIGAWKGPMQLKTEEVPRPRDKSLADLFNPRVGFKMTVTRK